MRTLVSWLIVAAFGISIVGCGGGSKLRKPTPKPAWTLSGGTVEGGMGAVGSASASVRGYAQTRKNAIVEARDELARSLGVKVKTLSDRFFQEAKDFLNEQANLQALDFTKDVTRQVSAQLLQGSVVKDTWENPETGEVFVWVVLDGKAVAEKL